MQGDICHDGGSANCVYVYLADVSYHQQLWRSWDHASWYISTVKPTRCTNIEFIECHCKCFRRSFHPSSGVKDCIYSFRCMSYRFVDCLLANTRSNSCSICFRWSFHPSSEVQDCTYSFRCMSYRFVDCLLMGTRVPSCACQQAVNEPVWHIPEAVCTVLYCWLFASRHEMEREFHLVPASKQSMNLYDIHLKLYVQSCTADCLLASTRWNESSILDRKSVV
jgi:hypothetical protein